MNKKFSSKKREVLASATSWGPVASWYDKHLEKDKDTYHDKVIHPNLMRVLGSVKGKRVVDLACGQGIFSRLLADAGASVIGIDLGKELIELAEKKNKPYKFSIHYFNTASDDLYMVKNGSIDSVVCVLALQNIERLDETMKELSRVLAPSGTCVLVLNHPAFRIPRASGWGYDERENVQYRRVDHYLSPSKVKIDMTPGEKKNKTFTVSFHRPLQVYMKAFAKHGFLVSRLEEWNSHKESGSGPRKKAEDIARKEIPLFMCLELVRRP